MSKDLVVYFSASGTTKRAAEKLAEAMDAEVQEIIPEVPYTPSDLNWRDTNSRSSLEMKDKSSRPAVLKDDVNPQDYETIYLGFPIWWYTAPTIVNSWLEEHDLKGKKVILFATSGGSGLGNSAKDLLGSAPDTKIVNGSLIRGSDSPADLKSRFIQL